MNGKKKKKLQRHCEEVYTDLEETKEVQEERIEYSKKKVNQQLTEEVRNAEITVDLVLQARAILSDSKVVNGPEDAIVSEVVKRLPMEKNTTAKCFQERFMGQMDHQARGRW